MDRYHFKTNAVEKIWHLMSNGARQTKKRALQIWKQKKNFDAERLSKLRRLVLYRRNQCQSLALRRWQTESDLMMGACRQRLLQMDFTRKVMLSHVFSRMVLVIKQEKRQRIRTLNTFVKAWRDYIGYNR